MCTMSIRYLLVVTAVIGVSIAVIQSPNLPENAIPDDASLSEPLEEPRQPSLFHHFLTLWPVRFLAYVGSVTLTLHTIAVAIGLTGVAKWIPAFTVPIVAEAVWKWYSVNRLGYHPGSLSIWNHVQFGLLINSLSCISLAAILAIPRLRHVSKSTKQD